MASEVDRPLTGKVALVTGAGTGIGQAAAVALAAAGARVAICGRRQAPLEETAAQIQRAGGVGSYRAVDVADPAQVQDWVSHARNEYGQIDLLVNAAGTNAPRRSWANTSMESWNEIIATNLTGIFVCCEAVLPIMRQQQGGLIVNVSSMAGVQASLVSGVAYSASKFGVMSLTQSLNLEEWRNGIRATVIAPGEVNTPIMEKRPNPPPPHAYPLMIQPEDLGAMIAFLAQLPPRVVVEEIRVRPMPMSRPEEAMEDTRVVPLFPLATVLFPGAVLPLRVFEDRYKVMVRECLQTDGSLGIVLIREGWEVGDPATPFEVGTLARIIRTEAASDGTLSIAVIGRRRFRIQSLLDGKPYRQGAVELLADDPPKLAESELSRLRRRLGEYRELLGRLSPESQPRFRLPAGPLELSYAVAGQLRIPRAEQQRLLEVTAEQRLRLANDILRRELVLLRHLGAIASPRLPAPASLPKN